jgi:hypothetical protein
MNTASNGITYQPHPNGWSCDIERMRKYDCEGRLHFPSKPGGQLRLKMYLDSQSGTRLQNIWDDIPALNSQAQERLGYPPVPNGSKYPFMDCARNLPFIRFLQTVPTITTDGGGVHVSWVAINSASYDQKAQITVSYTLPNTTGEL